MERADIFFETGKCDYATPNFYQLSMRQTNDQLWGQQWGASNTGQHSGIVGADVRIEQAWALTRGNNVRVAVLDDGVQLDHPDLQAHLLPGFDALGGGTSGGPINSNDDHGTSVAGIIGAIADNNIGIAGVAPDCRIIPIRVYSDNNNTGSAASLARGLELAWQNGASVINCSFRLRAKSDIVDNSIRNAIIFGRNSLGCVIIASAGNDNTSTISYPAFLPNVIAVGAMSMCNTRKSYQSCDGENDWGSNYGDGLAMVAPGVKISTLRRFGGMTDNFNGTSSAAPHVAGVAALVLALRPNLRTEEVRRILEYSCNKVGSYCYTWTASHPNGGWTSEMGYGRINAFNAVQLAQRSISYSTPYQNSSLVSNDNFQLSVLGYGCSALGTAVYFVQRYEVSKNIIFLNTAHPLIICTSNGWSAANPNDGKNFATAENVTNVSATLKSYVYKGYNSLGQFVGWFPVAPANVKFTYSVIGANASVNYQLMRMPVSSNTQDSGKIDFQFDIPTASHDIPVNILPGNKHIVLSPNPTLTSTYVHNTFVNKKLFQQR